MRLTSPSVQIQILMAAGRGVQYHRPSRRTRASADPATPGCMGAADQDEETR